MLPNLSGVFRRVRYHPRLYWSVALAFALISGLLISGSLRRAEAARHAWGDAVGVFVTRRAVPAGQPLLADDVARRDLPAAVLGYGTPSLDPIGRTPRVDLLAGEVVIDERLADQGVHGSAARLAPGWRGVAVPCRRGMLELARGDLVDVFAVAEAGIDQGGADAVLITSSAMVIDRSDDQLTIAVDAVALPAVVAGLARGQVNLPLAGGP